MSIGRGGQLTRQQLFFLLVTTAKEKKNLNGKKVILDLNYVVLSYLKVVSSLLVSCFCFKSRFRWLISRLKNLSLPATVKVNKKVNKDDRSDCLLFKSGKPLGSFVVWVQSSLLNLLTRFISGVSGPLVVVYQDYNICAVVEKISKLCEHLELKNGKPLGSFVVWVQSSLLCLLSLLTKFISCVSGPLVVVCQVYNTCAVVEKISKLCEHLDRLTSEATKTSEVAESKNNHILKKRESCTLIRLIGNHL